MIPEVFYDSLRWVNIVLSIVAGARLIEEVFRHWKKTYTFRDQIIWHCLFGTTFTIIVASIENLAQDNPGGPRVILTTVLLIFITWSTYLDIRPHYHVVEKNCD